MPRASWVRRRRSRSRRRTRMFVSSFIHSCFAFTDLCFTQPPPSPSPPPQPVRQTAAPLLPDAAAVFASPRPTPSAPVRLVFLFLMGRACVWLTPAFLARNIPQTFVCVGCQMSVLLGSSGVCKTAATVKRIMEVLQPDYNYTAGDFVCNSCKLKSKKPAKGKSTSVFFCDGRIVFAVFFGRRSRAPPHSHTSFTRPTQLTFTPRSRRRRCCCRYCNDGAYMACFIFIFVCFFC